MVVGSGVLLLLLCKSRNDFSGCRHGNSLNDAFDGFALEGNLVDNLDERKVVGNILGANELVGILGGDGTLKLLSVEQVRLDLVPEASNIFIVVVVVLLFPFAELLSFSLSSYRINKLNVSRDGTLSLRMIELLPSTHGLVLYLHAA